ncbi:flagellar hook protein FlgL [Shewanella mangrovi]|uniref:Flagellar hook protein FlgL n=1 Tax=Shewanella mangrovi TaxID=1515746 RepID=A0A094JWW9_9GAMM|nr:flagellar hook-associated protein FlgL [Shewanella mangrovi]KFZ36911.1 flagellar hook protein FlgL [Shewanella mangrovi]
MRISTAQLYNQSVSSINQHQSSSSALMDQISSGKRVNTAGDDPVASIGIDNLSQQNTLIDQFLKNIDYAKNHLGLAETQTDNAETVLSSMREKISAAVNGTLTDDERQGVADELNAGLQELLTIANSRDESGNYVFAGTAYDQQPFAFDNSGNIVYSGNNGVRTAVVASGVAIPTNIAGDAVFMNSPSGLGDFNVNYSTSQTGEFNVTSAQITNSASYVEDDYTLSFTANGSGGVDLQVFDSASNLISTVNNYDASNPISFNGIEIKLSATPADGDSFSITPTENVSIFDTIQQAISLLQDDTAINSPYGRSELAQLLNNFDSGTDQVRIARGIAGNSLNSLDSYTDVHSSAELANTSALSVLQDLDYASAVTEFEKQQVALNASSQLFGRLSSFNLFDFI